VSGLPPLKRIGPQDVPLAPSWMAPVFAFLNAIVDYLIQLADGGVSIADNLPGAVIELEVRTTADYDDGEFTRVRFPHGLPANQRALGVKILRVIDLGFPDAVLSGSMSCDGAWRENGKDILVDWIDGLEASHRYRVRFWVIA
jgi:hypothetical protein